MQPYFENDTTTLYQGDCLEVMAALPANSVDLVLADIPYGSTRCAWDRVIKTGPMWKAINRVARRNAAVVLTCTQPFTSVLVASKLKWFKHMWVWDKGTGVGFQNAKNKPMQQHEDVAVFSVGGGSPTYNPIMIARDKPIKGKAYTVSLSSPLTTIDDVMRTYTEAYPKSIVYCPVERGLHPTQKPVALMEYFIVTYSNAGATVLDFTCGSGTTLVAAQQCGRRAIGIERDLGDKGNVLGYCDIAVERLAQQVMVLE